MQQCAVVSFRQSVSQKNRGMGVLGVKMQEVSFVVLLYFIKDMMEIANDFDFISLMPELKLAASE